MLKINDNILTVAEVSAATGLTKQAIYKRLDTTLKKYVVLVEKKRLLKKEAIKVLIAGIENTEVNSVEEKNNSKINGEKEKGGDYSTLNNIYSTLNNAMEMLNNQIKEKDSHIKGLMEQIELLSKEIEKQNVHSREQSVKLIELIEQNNQLQQNDQLLLSQTLQLESSKTTVEKASTTGEEDFSTVVKKKKKRWFNWRR